MFSAFCRVCVYLWEACIKWVVCGLKRQEARGRRRVDDIVAVHVWCCPGKSTTRDFLCGWLRCCCVLSVRASIVSFCLTTASNFLPVAYPLAPRQTDISSSPRTRTPFLLERRGASFRLVFGSLPQSRSDSTLSPPYA